MKKAARASLLLLVLACAAPEPARHVAHRVVSLAPNVTEILFALGAGFDADVVGGRWLVSRV